MTIEIDISIVTIVVTVSYVPTSIYPSLAIVIFTHHYNSTHIANSVVTIVINGEDLLGSFGTELAS